MVDDPILTAFDHLVSECGRRILIVAPGKDATAAEVGNLADVVKARVSGAGIPARGLVGLAAPNGPGFFAGYLGLRRAGYRVLLIDWPVPEEELDRIFLALGAAGALIVKKSWPTQPGDFSLRPSRAAMNRLEISADISTVRLTSGSTGVPRGIAHSSEALLHDDRALRKTMGLRDERALAATPLSHAYGFSSVFLPALTCGWTVVVPSGGGPFGMTDAALAGGVTFLPTVPAYLNSLLKMSEPPPLPESLRLVISAGAPLRPETAVRFKQTYQQDVHVFYGASEVGGITYDRIGSAAVRGTLGSAVDGVKIDLISDDADESGSGVVMVESGSTAVGYYPTPEPCLQNGRFTTSDIGRFDGSELVLLGRVDDVINVRGKKVRPQEVEALLEGIPGVDEAVVIKAPAADGSGDAVQALVAARGHVLSDIELLGACRSRLAVHKIPRRIRIVDSIPRTSRGKIDHEAVRTLLSEGDA
jgi:acyl-coenzyme A synthetase/AMP-(fatty) acid ligase